jgi:2-polyprenyl-6-methoxyphenol hydroxylase-like FAD-dependent oxidoreductase
VMDPITGQGIGNAMQDAEALSEAVAIGLDTGGNLNAELARFGRKRDAARMPMYDMTTDLTSFRASRRAEILFAAISQNAELAERFFGVLTGAISPKEFFSPVRLGKAIGVASMLRLLRTRT